MRIKKLTIHNIASIEDAVIDFQGNILNNEPLFLITGDTGSGKTTILDAVCLALYKKTPRTNADNKEKIYFETFENAEKSEKDSITTDSTKLLMRRNTAEAYSILEFTDNDNNERTAKWYVARAYKKVTGKIQKEEHSIYNATTGNTISNTNETLAEVVRCTGMNFEQFCRTCMLSQGDFTKFLRSKENEKSEILEKLTGTEIYSVISKNIFDITKQKKQILDNYTVELNAVKILTEDEKQNITDSVNRNTEELRQKTDMQSRIIKKYDYLKRYNELVATKNKQTEELKLHTDYFNGENYKQESNTVKLWRDTVYYRSLNNDIKNYQNLLDRYTKEVNIYKNRFLQLIGGIKYHTSIIEKIQQSHKDIDKEILLLQQETETKTLQYKTYDLNSLTSEYQYCSQRKEKLAALKSCIELSYQDKIPIQRTSALLTELQTNNNNILQTIDYYQKQLPTLEQEYQQSKMRYDKIASSLDSWAKKTRLTLTAGDICPLCGQEINEIIQDGDFAKIAEPLSDDMQQKEKAKNDAINQLNKYTNEYNITLQNINKQSEALNQLQKEYDKHVVKINTLAGELEISDINIENTVDVDRLLNDIQNQADVIFKKIQSVNALSGQITELQTRKTSLISIKQQLENEIMIVNSCIEIKNQLNDFTQKWDTTEVQPIEIADVLQKWNKLKDDFFVWKNHIETQRNNIKDCTEKINKFKTDNPQINFEDIVKLDGLTQSDIDNIQMLHQQRIEQKNILQGALDHVTKEIQELQLTDIKLEEGEDLLQLQKQINELSENIKEIQIRIGGLNTMLKQNEDNIALFDKKMQQKEKLNKEYLSWDMLNKEFGSSDGKKFRSIAQSFILGDLLDKANYYMERFSDRYELTCQDSSLTILIKDNYEGGILSSTASLSGGESFMVSLSLALGLAKMTSNNSFADILFIDEGFGTLSSGCLNTIMDTLEKLHNIGGRKVGIISHVAELKEKIPVQIQVQRTDVTKSKVNIIRL